VLTLLFIDTESAVGKWCETILQFYRLQGRS
jgi:hypothetical protein